MTKADRRGVSEFLGNKPYGFDSGDLRPRRRARFFWPTWEVIPRAGVVLEETEDVVRVRLSPSRPKPVNQWLDDGWEVPDTFDGHFPTLTKPVPVARPRWHTPGDNTCDDATRARWASDSYGRPPIHYEERSGSNRESAMQMTLVLSSLHLEWFFTTRPLLRKYQCQ